MSRMSLDLARRLVDAAVAAADNLGVRVSVCIVDEACREVLTQRGDGAMWFTPAIARSKAATAAATGRPTADFAAMIAELPELLSQLAQSMAITPTTLGGGLALIGDEGLIGGIGVSGATEEQDIACAQAALQALGL